MISGARWICAGIALPLVACGDMKMPPPSSQPIPAVTGAAVFVVNGADSSLSVIDVAARAVVGTIALILVAGGIFAHNIHFLHDLLPQVPSIIKEVAYGIIVGLIAVGAVTVIKKIIALFRKSES